MYERREMGRKDTVDKRIEKNNDVFADIFNTLLFKKEVIQPSKLKPGVTNVLVESKDGIRERNRDECKIYEDSSLIVVSLGIENQTERDNLMPVRVMGYDYGEYLEQITNAESFKLPYLNSSITIVLNFSDTRWGKPKSLKECIAYNEELWPYVNDYKIHVIDMNFLTDEEIGRFKSDLKGIFTLLKDMREGKFEPWKYDFRFKHPEDSYRFISAYLHDERLEEVMDSVASEKREEKTMCEAFEKWINDRMEIGMERGIERGETAILISLIIDESITIEKALTKTSLTKEAFMNELYAAGYTKLE